MGNKGYRNTAKSGVKAASARRRQVVARERTRDKPRQSRPPRRRRIEAGAPSDDGTPLPQPETPPQPQDT